MSQWILSTADSISTSPGLQHQVADWCKVMQAITQLPQLQNLELRGVPLDGFVGTQLPVAAQVVSLDVAGVVSLDVSSKNVEAVLLCLVHAFTGLHQLKLSTWTVVDSLTLCWLPYHASCTTCRGWACRALSLSRLLALHNCHVWRSCAVSMWTVILIARRMLLAWMLHAPWSTCPTRRMCCEPWIAWCYTTLSCCRNAPGQLQTAMCVCVYVCRAKHHNEPAAL